MKFYKIVNPNGHNGLKYKEGLNVDPLPFNPSGDCEPGGIYFAREDIFYYLDYGSEVYQVEPVGEVYENPSIPKKFKAHSVVLKYIGETNDVETLKTLVEDGANIHAYGDYALGWSAGNGHLKIVKYLVEMGANIYAYGDYAFQFAANNGHLDVVKYLAEQGVDLRAGDNYALRWSALHGHLKVVKYLVSKGANIHADDDYAFRWAAGNGHLEVVKFLIENGTNIHAGDDYAFRWAAYSGHLKVVKYLNSIIEKEKEND